MIQRVSTLAAAIAAVTLAGCDVQPQDATGEDSREGLTGLAIDGRVANGKVWADRNNNNRIDDFEPYAYTDSDGYYSYNPLSNTNYCALPVISDEYQRHCLLYGASTDAIVIRIKGGTDLSTGEKLKGVMAMGTSISDSSQISSSPLVLSPITTLLSSAEDDNARNTIRNTLGVTSDDDLRLDFSTAEDSKSRKFLANSVAVQTMMDVLVSSADDTSDSVNHEVNVIQQITNRVVSGNKSPADLDDTDLSEVAQIVTADTTKQTSVSSRLKDLNAVIKEIENAADADSVKTRLKAAEVVSQLVKKEASGDDSDAVKKVLDGNGSGTGIEDLTNSLETNMSDTTVEYDITSVTNSLVDAGETAVTSGDDFDSTSVDGAVEDAKLADDTVWGGSWFVMRATDEYADDLTDGSYIAIYLSGDADAKKGSISVCANATVNPDEGEEIDPDESFVNEYIGGRWNEINAGMVTLTFDYEGQEFEGSMKAKVATAESGAYAGNRLFRFSSDIDGATEQGDLVLDVNAVSALANASRPTSAEDCEADVDSQI